MITCRTVMVTVNDQFKDQMHLEDVEVEEAWEHIGRCSRCRKWAFENDVALIVEEARKRICDRARMVVTGVLDGQYDPAEASAAWRHLIEEGCADCSEFARTNVDPRISEEAAERIVRFEFAQLRNELGTKAGIRASQ